jgi:outer membrane protein TolC
MKTIATTIWVITAVTATTGTLFPVGAAETNALVLTPSMINQLSEEMRTNHPALRASQARTSAAEANTKTVRVWEDPMLKLGGMISETGMRAEDGDIIYGVEQKLPLFGKPQLARRVVEAELVMERADADYQFQQLRRDLVQALFRTAMADRTVQIGEQDLGWLATMVTSMENRYATGDATQAQVLRIQNERARRTDQLRTDRAKLEHEWVAMNRLLNRDLNSAWPKLELPPIASPVRYSQRLVELALKYEPKLKLLRRSIQKSEALVKMTRRRRLPDFSVGVQGRNYTGTGEFRQAEVMVGFNFPWGNNRGYQSEIEREEALLGATELDVTAYELALREEVHLLTVKIDAARREALLYLDEIVPRSEQALAAAHASWMSGGGDKFLDVMEARRMLIEGQLMHARALAEQYSRLSELVLCCGLGNLEALEMIGGEPETTKP